MCGSLAKTRCRDAVLPATEKLAYIVSTANATVHARIASELRELNNYRNWIAHEFPYSTTVLLSPEPEGTFLEVDREDSVNWESKFPNTKFQPIDRMDSTDATTAVRIVLECIKLIAIHIIDSRFWVNPLHKGPDHRFIHGGFDVDAYIAEQSGG